MRYFKSNRKGNVLPVFSMNYSTLENIHLPKFDRFDVDPGKEAHDTQTGRGRVGFCVKRKSRITPNLIRANLRADGQHKQTLAIVKQPN